MTEMGDARSVRARLLKLSRAQGEDIQRLLVRYAIERLLYRLSVSIHADDFVLKGATLFALWMGKPHRATKDLDLLGRGSPDVARLILVFHEIASIACPEDGMAYDHEAIIGAPIRESALYAAVSPSTKTSPRRCKPPSPDAARTSPPHYPWDSATGSPRTA